MVVRQAALGVSDLEGAIKESETRVPQVYTQCEWPAGHSSANSSSLNGGKENVGQGSSGDEDRFDKYVESALNGNWPRCWKVARRQCY